MNNDMDILMALLVNGHHYLSLNERDVAQRLKDKGFVTVWDTVGGFPAWGVSDEGREELKRQGMI